MLVLSLFPGIGLLDRAFEEEGFCVVRGPDVLWGGDIKCFHAPAGVFSGVIGGPPCQDFSRLAAINHHLGRIPKFGNLISEFERVTAEAQPAWFLMENVEPAPLPSIDDYITRAFLLNNRWLGEEQNRLRRFSFGTRDGRSLQVDGLTIFEHANYEPAVLSVRGYMVKDRDGYAKPAHTIAKMKASRTRSIARMAELQGLPPTFLSDAPFTVDGKRKAIANGVPLPMGRAIARAVRRVLESADAGD